MQKKRGDLKNLLAELEAGQAKMAAGEKLSQADAEALDAKAAEAEALQKEIRAYDARQRLINEGKKGDFDLPNDDQPDDESKSDRETKSFQRAGDGEPVAGYMNLGDFV